MSAKSHRKGYDGAFKTRVVLKILRGEKTLAEIAAEFGIHPNQIVTWKKHVMEALPELLSRKVKTSAKQQEELQNELYKQIGELKVQNELPLSTYYYHAASPAPSTYQLMKLIDQIYLKYPFYGVRRITKWLNHHYPELGPLNHKRIARLMQQMGIQGIYPKKKLSIANKEHHKYPYLLKDRLISNPDEVWATDVMYKEVYLHGYETVREAEASIRKYIHFYNHERLHSPLGYRTPYSLYQEKK